MSEKAPQRDRYYVAGGLGMLAALGASATLFLPLHWRDKSSRFTVTCPPRTAPQVIDFNLYENYKPFIGVSCFGKKGSHRPIMIEQVGHEVFVDASKAPQFDLTVGTSHDLGIIQDNDLSFTVSRDRGDSTLTDIQVNNNDAVFLTYYSIKNEL